MIAKLIAFLQWIESSNAPRKWFDYFFSFSFAGTSMVLIYSLLEETILRSYSRYYGYSDGAFFSPSITSNGWIFSLTCLFLAAIVATYVYGIYKKLTYKDFSLVRIIMNGVLPLTIGILLIYLHADERDSMKWYFYLFGGLYALSPFSLFVSGFESGRKNGISRISKFYRYYINAFLISLAIFLPLFVLGELFRDLRYMDFSEIVIVSFIALCTYSIVTWFVLTYAWMESEDVTETAWKNTLRGSVALAGLFLIIWLSPNWKEIIIEGRIEAAQSQLQKYGETKEGLQKASNVWFLEWALKEKYLKGNLYSGEKELYARLYDTSIESAIDEELDTEKFKARNSNATSMLARGENAKVELNFAKHESEILSDIGAIRTTITYEFQNTSTTNQEVVFSFILPDAESVMTDLRLGLNLEYEGIIAPRGAASKVYQDSLRRNTDPALLEQTGPVSYRLRVFPVLSTSDTKTQGRQRVQLVYVSPLGSDTSVTLIPKTNILNLKLTDTSEILTRVTDGGKVLNQDSLQTDDIETLTEGKTETLSEKTEKSYKNFCSANTYPTLDMTSFETTEKKLSKNIVFFDISKSVGEKSGIKKRYQSLVDAWKNSGVALDIFTYNFDIYPSGYTLANLDFWGTTDMSKIIDYIEKNALTDANIVIVTDDNSYERASAEIKTIDYKKLKSNKISLIQVGDQVRTLKTEITKAILATEGEMIVLDEDTPLSLAVKNIFAPEEKVGPCASYSGASLPSLQALQGYSDGRKVYGEKYTKPVYMPLIEYKSSDSASYYIEPQSSSGEDVGTEKPVGSFTWNEDAMQEEIAKTARIVNQSVSLIAVESDQQRADLERYAQQEDKYDTRYENFTNEGGVPERFRPIGDMVMEMPRSSNTTFSANNATFGMTKADGVSVGSSSNMGPNSMSLGLGGGSRSGASGGYLQYILILIGFPVIAYFVLRRKPSIQKETPPPKAE